MTEDSSPAFPLKLVLFPALLGFLTWGVMAETAHGMLGTLSFAPWLIFLGAPVYIIVALIEVCAVPIGLSRLSSNPSLRTTRNILSVIVGCLFLFLALAFLVIDLL